MAELLFPPQTVALVCHQHLAPPLSSHVLLGQRCRERPTASYVGQPTAPFALDRLHLPRIALSPPTLICVSAASVLQRARPSPPCIPGVLLSRWRRTPPFRPLRSHRMALPRPITPEHLPTGDYRDQDARRVGNGWTSLYDKVPRAECQSLPHE
jgi:hypothetical protein